MKRHPYLIDKRLAEVIRLISALAIYEKNSYRTEEGLKGILNGEPESVEGSTKWLDLGKEHQEFFKFNKDGNAVILLIRYLMNPERDDKGIRDPLDLNQTQKLIDHAIALHDKQLALYQRNSFKVPMYAAVIAAAVSLIVATVNIIFESSTKASVEALSKRVDSLSADIKTSNMELLKAIEESVVNETIEAPQADSLH